MSIETKLYQKLSQQLIMTPQLQQSIKLLQLSKLDLVDAIQKELEENPVLEEDFSVREEPDSKEEAEKLSEEDWDSYLSSSNFDRAGGYVKDDDESSFESYTPQKTNLVDHLLWQLMLSNIDGEEMEIGEVLISNINDDGYLISSIDEIAELKHYNTELVEDTLELIQDFDPSGVGARDLKECLLLQMKNLGIHSELLEKIITGYFPLLEKKEYKRIARSLDVSIDELMIAVKIISGLEPKPGRPFQHETSSYITPDIYVFKIGKEFVVMPNEDGIPKIKISDHYKNFTGNLEKDHTCKDYVLERIRSGNWFIRSLHQRQRTICKVTESIVKFQRNFFEQGIRHLKPLVLREIAEDIGVHESTISRVTSNKYVHTPQGLFELKYFFCVGIECSDGVTTTQESIKDMVKKLIENEDPEKPLSDDAISEVLKKSGIDIARRTVTKYRIAGKIPTSTARARERFRI